MGGPQNWTSALPVAVQQVAYPTDPHNFGEGMVRRDKSKKLARARVMTEVYSCAAISNDKTRQTGTILICV